MPRFKHAFYYTVDGNFKLKRKTKRGDPLDVPLTSGAAYFAPEEVFGLYYEVMKDHPVEVCGCPYTPLSPSY